jgi:hypothetical protein
VNKIKCDLFGNLLSISLVPFFNIPFLPPSLEIKRNELIPEKEVDIVGVLVESFN